MNLIKTMMGMLPFIIFVALMPTILLSIFNVANVAEKMTGNVQEAAMIETGRLEVKYGAEEPPGYAAFEEYCHLILKRKSYEVIYEEPMKSQEIAKLDKQIAMYDRYNFTRECD